MSRSSLGRCLLLLSLALMGCPHDLDRGSLEAGGDGGWLDACVPTNAGVEICDGLDNDCDGVADNVAGLDSDASNCGKCGNVCKLTSATAACVKGACVVKDCERNAQQQHVSWDLDGKTDNGCEYLCIVSHGGHEICDKKDNDCDGETDEKCSSLLLLYHFENDDSIQAFPDLANHGVAANIGQYENGAIRSCGAVGGGVPGEASDGCTLQLDGKDDLVVEQAVKSKLMLDCDSITGWSAKGGSIVKAPLKEGAGALHVPGFSDGDGLVAEYSGKLDLSKWVSTADNHLKGFLVFWVHVQDATKSTPGKVLLGTSPLDNHASWAACSTHVVGPLNGGFVNGWNMVALPLASATYSEKSGPTDWSKVTTFKIHSNKVFDTGVNAFIFDDFRLLENMTQHFSKFTLMAWAKPDKVSAKACVAHKDYDSPSICIEPAGGGATWQFRTSATTQVASKVQAVAGSWAHLAQVYDGFNLTAYVDGAPQGTLPAAFVPGELLRIGCAAKSDRCMEGRIDEVAIYDRALTPAELTWYVKLFSP